jgi:hypothetical protein
MLIGRSVTPVPAQGACCHIATTCDGRLVCLGRGFRVAAPLKNPSSIQLLPSLRIAWLTTMCDNPSMG